jgi:hypothetical protein
MAKITKDTCPECGMPEVMFEHVLDGYSGQPAHRVVCECCGEYYALVAWDCPECPKLCNYCGREVNVNNPSYVVDGQWYCSEQHYRYYIEDRLEDD